VTKPETEALTAAHFAACNGWALGVIEAAFHEQRAKETMELIDTVMGGE
jgi:hypothetical protein